MKKFIIYLLFGIILSSCDKEVDNIKLPDPNPKLVVHSFISPFDTLHFVSVNNSLPILGKQTYETLGVSGATVTISDGTNNFHLKEDTVHGIYYLKPEEFPVIAGKTYHLSVTAPDGRKAEASCKIPEVLAEITEYEIDTVEWAYSDNDIDNEFLISFSWKDPQPHTNYYRIYGFYEKFNEYLNKEGMPQPIDFETEFFTNIENTSGQFTSSFARFEYLRKSSKLPPYKLSLYVLSVDEHYYKYHQSVRSVKNDNPFAEPTLIYSNIQGGLGVFAGYNKTSLVIKNE